MPRRLNQPFDLQRIAHERLGFESLRPGQEDGIRSVLAGRDTLVVMPTGSGKSAIYQIPALALSGPTVVVSPLIALQRDQAVTLADQDVGGAAMVNSAIPVSERREAFESPDGGTLEFVFLSPEQLQKEGVIERLRAAVPSLFVVDEAHCISEWGHDFRPDYLRLSNAIEALGHPTVLALTATAAPMVREEIIERLGMRDPRVIVRGFDRPNIWLGVEYFPKAWQKLRVLVERVEQAQKPGIVYVATRKHAEEVADALIERGQKALVYHSGLRPKERHEIQDDFMADRAEVIVATNAFGMGVDKPNVRFVFHYDASDSIDAYYQEIGRAGRDGEPARAVLFYHPADLNLHRFFAGGGRLDADGLERVAAAVHEEDGPLTREALQEKTRLSRTKLARALSRLEEAGAVQILPGGEVVPTQTVDDLRAAAEEAEREQHRRHRHTLLRLERMGAYAEVHDCRRRYLLDYFGEEVGPCGRCDNCERGLPERRETSPRTARGPRTAQRVAAEDDLPYPLKTRVVHKTWGKGLVQGYEGEHVRVLFHELGEKTLSLKHVLENALLQRAG